MKNIVIVGFVCAMVAVGIFSVSKKKAKEEMNPEAYSLNKGRFLISAIIAAAFGIAAVVMSAI